MGRELGERMLDFTKARILSDVDGVIANNMYKFMVLLQDVHPVFKKIIDEKDLKYSWQKQSSYNVWDWFMEAYAEGISPESIWDCYRDCTTFYDTLEPTWIRSLYKTAHNEGRLHFLSKTWINSAAEESKCRWLDKWFPDAGYTIVPIGGKKTDYTYGYFGDGTPIENFDIYVEDSKKELELMHKDYQEKNKVFFIVDAGHNKTANFNRLPGIT